MYKDFVKMMFDKYRGQMPPKDIMKMAAAEYKKMKMGKPAGKQAKGAGIIGDVGAPLLGIADNVGSLFGLGLEKKARKPRAKKALKGAGVIGEVGAPLLGIADNLGSLFGLGVGMEKRIKRSKETGKGGYLSAGNLEPQSPYVRIGGMRDVPYDGSFDNPDVSGGSFLDDIHNVSKLLPLLALA